MKDIHLSEEHFEMLTVPQNLNQLKSDLSGRDFELPHFPITIEIPCKNGDIQAHVLDFEGVLTEGQL